MHPRADPLEQRSGVTRCTRARRRNARGGGGGGGGGAGRGRGAGGGGRGAGGGGGGALSPRATPVAPGVPAHPPGSESKTGLRPLPAPRVRPHLPCAERKSPHWLPLLPGWALTPRARGVALPTASIWREASPTVARQGSYVLARTGARLGRTRSTPAAPSAHPGAHPPEHPHSGSGVGSAVSPLSTSQRPPPYAPALTHASR